MDERVCHSTALESLPGPTDHRLDMDPGRRSRLRGVLERLLALGYGSSYDAIVRSFAPYQALLREVSGFVARGHGDGERGGVKVLDVACGTGTVAFELARLGYSVVGLDAVAPLVEIARRRTTGTFADRVAFQQADVACDAVPGAGTYDVLVSMHTLYWHDDPVRFLEGCRRALRPGGHAVFLTYGRPARLARTFRDVQAREGAAAAVRALRWLVPTALFERFRDYEPHYLTQEEFHGALARAGFDVLDARRTFLAGISLLAWVRARGNGTSRPR